MFKKRLAQIRYLCLGLVFTSLLTFVQNPIAVCQNYEWASGTTGIGVTINHSSISDENKLLVSGRSSRGFQSYQDIGGIVESDGTVKRFNSTGEFLIVYSPDGSVEWSLEFSNEYNEVRGVTHQDSFIVLLIFIDEMGADLNDFPIGYIKEFTEEEIRLGLNLFFLNKNGEYVKHKTLFNMGHSDLEVVDFENHPDGGFVISAFADDGIVCHEFSQKAGDGGADLLLKLDETGKPSWLRLVSNESKSCCTFFSTLPQITISEDGTIFMTSTYHYGAKFSDKITIRPESSRKQEAKASYLAAYSAEGNFKWVSNSIQNVKIEAIACNKEEILLGVNILSGDKAFDIKVDTAYGKTNALITINRRGKVKRGISLSARLIHDINTTNEGTFIVLGGSLLPSSKQFSSDRSKNNFFIAEQNNRGWSIFQKTGLNIFHQSKIYYNKNEESPKLLIDSNNELIVAGSVFYSLKFELSEVDKRFHSINAYGAAAVITKIKDRDQ